MIVLAYLALLSLGFLDNVRGAVFESLTQELHLSDQMAALFFAIPSSFAFLSGLWVANIIHRTGPIYLIRLGLLVMTLAYALFSLHQPYLWLLVQSAVFGFGFGILSVAQNVTIGMAASPDSRRQLFSGLHAMYGLSSLLAPVVAQWGFALGWSWRSIFLIATALPVVVLVVGFLIRQKSSLAPTTAQEKLAVPPQVRRQGFIFALSMSLYLIAEISVSSRLVVFVRRELQLTETEAPIYLTVFFASLFVSRVLFGFISFRKISSLQLMQMSLLGSAALSALGLALNPWFLALTGFTFGPFFPMALDYVSHRFGTYAPPIISQCVAFASMTTVVMHFGVGYLSDLFGIKIALWSGPIALLMVSLLFILEARRAR